MADIIVALIIILIIGAALIYIIKEKKKGTKCIGCPMAGSCGGHCKGNSSRNGTSK